MKRFRVDLHIHSPLSPCRDLEKYAVYTASDTHSPAQIGTNPTWLEAESCSFDELRAAFAGEGGRRVISCRENR